VFTFQSLKRVPIEAALAGDIVAVTGLGDVDIGVTVMDPKRSETVAADYGG